MGVGLAERFCSSAAWSAWRWRCCTSCTFPLAWPGRSSCPSSGTLCCSGQWGSWRSSSAIPASRKGTIAWLYRWLAFRLYFLPFRLCEVGEQRSDLAQPERTRFPLLDAAASDRRGRLVRRQASARIPACFYFHGAGDRALCAVPDLCAATDPVRRGMVAAGPASPDLRHGQLYVLQPAVGGDHRVSVRRSGVAGHGVDAAAGPSMAARKSRGGLGEWGAWLQPRC